MREGTSPKEFLWSYLESILAQDRTALQVQTYRHIEGRGSATGTKDFHKGQRKVLNSNAKPTTNVPHRSADANRFKK